MQLGPISRQPARRTLSSEHRLARAPFRVALAEAGADHADRPDVLADAVVDRREHLGGRDDDDREIDRTGDVGHSRIGGQAADLQRGRVHRHDRAGEAGGDQVVEDFGSDLAALAVGADDRDDAGLEERLHRRRRGGSATAPRRGPSNAR